VAGTVGGVAPDPTSTNGGARRRLGRNLVVLTAVSLTQDAASELLYPLLPLLLTGALAAPPVVVGVIEGVADATAGLTRFVAGRWSDRRGRRPFITGGYGLAALGKVVVAAAGAWPVVLAGRVLDRFGKGLRSAPRDALLASSVPREQLGRAFGFHRAGDTLGAVIGPLLGLLALASLDDDLRAALWWAVVPAVLSVVLTFFVREPVRPGRRRPADATSAPAAAAGGPLPSRYWAVTVVLVAVSLVNFSDALLLLRLSELGLGTNAVVLAYVGYNAVAALGAYPAGVLADRCPRPVVYGVGLLAFAVGYVGLGLVDGAAAGAVLLAVYGLFPACTDGVGKAWIASLVPLEGLGRAQGTFQALTSGSVLLAGTWAGLAWRSGPGRGVVPLLVAGSVAGGAAVLLLGPLRRLDDRVSPGVRPMRRRAAGRTC
jgi:MFS family permease